VCKEALSTIPTSFHCQGCARSFEVVDGIPDFFISESKQDSIDDPNKTWLKPEIVEARDTVYRLCARELKGMTFCMQEIGRRTSAGCRVLEVGMGTGHFTCWLAEATAPGTHIYAFDFSWPIMAKAKVNTEGLSGITLFRANARGELPFKNALFDIVLVRLAPLGSHGVPNVQAAFKLLQPGGWLFEAGWKSGPFDTPPTELALIHGYESAEHHVWQYHRIQTEQEFAAMQTEMDYLFFMKEEDKPPDETKVITNHQGNRSFLKLTYENVLIARKPA
jgi:SAM-dependent methyltransferase